MNPRTGGQQGEAMDEVLGGAALRGQGGPWWSPTGLMRVEDGSLIHHCTPSSWNSARNTLGA